jgi:exodeoxyribonuclease VII large subunit
MTRPSTISDTQDTPDSVHPDRRHIFSVSELTDNIKNLLENTYPYIWISGEISNMHRHSSGHYYFTLKDRHAQISSVMFKGQARNLTFRPEDGQFIVAMGRISVYAPRGNYQVILEYMEQKGAGALLLAFEQLKARLAEEGLFDAARKRPLPFLPHSLCVITSPTGAVIHDIIHIIRRRFPSTRIRLIPVAVQGDGAPEDIRCAVERANGYEDTDVIILARGGGSIEDLSAFNSETVARAVFSSRVPVVSAVGHETDFTISDFVADLRAPTPSAAAEMVVPEREALIFSVTEMNLRLQSAMLRRWNDLGKQCRNLADRLVHPSRRIQDHRLHLDELFNRMYRTLMQGVAWKRQNLEWKTNTLYGMNPIRHIRNLRQKNDFLYDKLLKLNRYQNSARLSRLRQAQARLEGAGPLNILTRGYSITRTIPEGQVLRDAATVRVGRRVSVKLARGSLSCLVERIHPNGQTDV